MERRGGPSCIPFVSAGMSGPPVIATPTVPDDEPRRDEDRRVHSSVADRERATVARVRLSGQGLGDRWRPPTDREKVMARTPTPTTEAAELTRTDQELVGEVVKQGGDLARRRMKAAAQAAVLATLMGLLAWHTISWHLSGQHKELFDAIGESWWSTTKSVLYNLGLIAATGVLLGLFCEKLTDMIGYEVKKIDHFGDQEEPESTTTPDLTTRREAALAEEAAERVQEQVAARVR